MENDELKNVCLDVFKQVAEHNLGVFLVLSDTDGLVGANQFPTWSVLQYSAELDEDGDEKIEMVTNDNETSEVFFDRVKKTILYLNSLAERLDESAKVSRHLRDTMLQSLKDNGLVEVDTVKKSVLH